MRCVLGFDGGGTKTDCVLMDESGAVLARSRSGSSNPTTFGVQTAVDAVDEAAGKALSEGRKSTADVAFVLAGISGAGESAMRAALVAGLQPKFPNARIQITSDLVLSLAATGEIPSLVVIAGTGSAVLGRTSPVELARAGGFGPVIGDPGSAYDIGRKTAALCFQRQLDGGSFPLGEKILGELGCSFNELFDNARAKPGAVFPKLFQIVAGAAENGDSDSQALLSSAAADLRDQARHVIEKLKLRNANFFLAKTGGVFDGSPYLNAQFDAFMREAAPRLRLGPLPRTVAEAAALLACDALKSPLALEAS